jgi:hypothetical protein
MSGNNTAASSGGIGFMGLLAVLFIGLKLTGYITWSWWLVLLPIYGPLALVLCILAVFGLFAGLSIAARRR